MKKQKSKKDFNRIFYLLFLIMPILSFFLLYNELNHDFWFSINEGKYIINNGFPNTMLFTLHKNFSCILQSWGSLILFALIYNNFGKVGMYIWIIIMIVLIFLVLSKLCYLIGNKNKKLSILISGITIFSSCIFIEYRPQMFTYLNLLCLIYLLELYIKSDDIKYLKFLPLIALLQINVHGVFFLLLFVFMIPYIIDSFRFSIFNIKSEGYRLKPILITMFVMFIAGFINPYGIKTIFYGFNILGDTNLKSVIELNNIIDLPLIMKFVYLPFIFLLVYYLKNRSRIKLRYVLLILGTFILSLNSFRNLELFILISFFPSLSLINVDNKNNDAKFIKILYKVILVIFVAFLCILIKLNNPDPFQFDLVNIVDDLSSEYVIRGRTVYTDAENGGYLGYREMIPYIDCRMEMYLKKVNKKENVVIEYNSLQKGKINYKKFIDKYNFDFIIVDKMVDSMYYYMDKDSYNYKLIKEYKNYKVYVRNNIEKR